MKQKDVVPADGGWVRKQLRDFRGPVSERIGSEWMLIAAGDVGKDRANWNGMTASWGGLGVLWGRDVAFMFIRPSRHTRAFADGAGLFTLSFFPPSLHDKLLVWGNKSGRDCDKAGETGFTPVVFDGSVGGGEGAFAAGAVGFREASEIIVCRKLYTHDFEPERFLDKESIEKVYHGADYHRMYIGEVITLLTRRAGLCP
ncbi:MAG: flavin reductase [Treponematales bacterium]